MTALLTSERLNVLVLLDKEPQAEKTAEELIKSKLIRSDSVIWASEAWATSAPKEADIEDLLDAAVYDGLVQDTYKSELMGKALALNANIPRIVKRYEAAFQAVGLEFHKSRPAKEFLVRLGKNPASVLSPDAQARFETLFARIGQGLAKIQQRAAAPFAS
jgi:hypothetical protein